MKKLLAGVGRNGSHHAELIRVVSEAENFFSKLVFKDEKNE